MSAAPSPSDPDPPRVRGGRAPLEDPGGNLVLAALRTVAVAFVRLVPLASEVPEPVRHGRWIAGLALLRLAPWIVTVGIVAARWLDPQIEVAPLLPIHRFVPAPLARALSLWMLLLVPVGVPLAYFATGLVAHLGLVLTAGARWPLGASLRAVALAWAPVYLGAGVVEILAWSHALGARVVFAGLLATVGFAWAAGAVALAATHRIGRVHAAAAILPAVAVWAAVSVLRVALVAGTVPGLDLPPPSPYAVDVPPL